MTLTHKLIDPLPSLLPPWMTPYFGRLNFLVLRLSFVWLLFQKKMRFSKVCVIVAHVLSMTKWIQNFEFIFPKAKNWKWAILYQIVKNDILKSGKIPSCLQFLSQIKNSSCNSYSFLGTLNVSSLIVLAPSKNSIKTHLLISISLEMMMSHPLFLVVRFVLLWCCCWWYLQCFQLCQKNLVSKEPELFLKLEHSKIHQLPILQ